MKRKWERRRDRTISSKLNTLLDKRRGRKMSKKSIYLLTCPKSIPQNVDWSADPVTGFHVRINDGYYFMGRGVSSLTVIFHKSVGEPMLGNIQYEREEEKEMMMGKNRKRFSLELVKNGKWAKEREGAMTWHAVFHSLQNREGNIQEDEVPRERKMMVTLGEGRNTYRRIQKVTLEKKRWLPL